ncbi:MAG TPA: methyltransferase domain-containing protein [bacterium]|nr:methyltransferase domain-containing protein [bacterium]HQL61501.1 methyltransferase domain-containing protein [bacterium]
MKARLLEILVCPSCGNLHALELKDQEVRDQEIVSGVLVCTHCQAKYPIRDSIPRFVDSDQYADSFGFEWNQFNRVQLDVPGKSNESENTIKEKTNLTPEKVTGKVILDAGAGAGRFAEVISRWGAKDVIAADISSAVVACYRNIGERENVHVIQADLFHLPLRRESFDIVYSIGVLHHTPNTRDAFREVSTFLKSGGFMAIYVYSVTLGMAYTDYLRRITTRIPKRLLYVLSLVSVPLYYVYRVPVIGALLNTVFRISMHPHWRWRWLDTFDWYAPTYQWKHTYPEVFRWFKEAGFVDIDLPNTRH